MVYGRGSSRESRNERPGNRTVPIRLNEPLALFLLRPQIFMNPAVPAVGRTQGSSR